MELKEVVPGVISQIPILVLCVNIPMLIVDFRESSILKRLASSHIKKHNILLSFVLYGILISIISSIFVLLTSIIIYGNTTTAPAGSQKDQIALIESLKDVKIIGFLSSFLILLMLSGGIGIFVASFSKNVMLAMAFGLFILIPGGFLSAQYLSP
jgi:ABC-type multidrug transport system permease subunit